MISLKLRHAAPLLLAASVALSANAYAFDGWKLENATAIPGKNSAWDYVSLDATANRLFIGRRGNGLQVFDIASGKVIKTIANTAANSSSAGVAIQDTIVIYTNNAGTLSSVSSCVSTFQAA